MVIFAYPEGSAEGLRGQPKIQQHHTNYGRNERNVPRRFAAGDGERIGYRAGVRKKPAGVRFRCRKQAPELPEWVLEKDGENPAWGGRCEGVVQHIQPEFAALVLPDPDTQNVLRTIHGDAQNHVGRLGLILMVFLHLVMDGVQKHEQIIGKYSRNADGMEEKILGLYACGMSQRDISEHFLRGLLHKNTSFQSSSFLLRFLTERMSFILFYTNFSGLSLFGKSPILTSVQHEKGITNPQVIEWITDNKFNTKLVMGFGPLDYVTDLIKQAESSERCFVISCT